ERGGRGGSRLVDDACPSPLATRKRSFPPMNRSAPRRSGPLSPLSRNQRIAAAATILAAFAAMVTVTRVSSAQEQRRPRCGPTVAGAEAPDGQDITTTQQNGRDVRNHWGDGQQQRAGCPSNPAQTV